MGVEHNARRRLWQHMHERRTEHLTPLYAANESDRGDAGIALVAADEFACRVHVADVPAHEPSALRRRHHLTGRVARPRRELHLSTDRAITDRGLAFEFSASLFG